MTTTIERHEREAPAPERRRRTLLTATRRVGKILLVVSGKTVSDFLKIHTFLMFLFKTIFNENYKKLQALKLAFKSFSSKMSKLAIF